MINIGGSRVLSTSPCVADVSSVVLLENKKWVSCIDAAGELSLFPIDASSAAVTVVDPDDATPATAASASPFLKPGDAISNNVAVCQVDTGSANGLWIGCKNGKILVRSYTTTATHELDAKNDIVTHIVVSSDRKHVVCAGVQGVVCVFDAASRELVTSATVTSSSAPIVAMCLHKSASLWFADMKNRVIVIDDFRKLDAREIAAAAPSPVTCLVSVPALDLVCAGDESGKVACYGPFFDDLLSSSPLSSLSKSPPPAVTALAVSTIGEKNLVWAATLDGGLMLWSPQQRAIVKTVASESSGGYICAMDAATARNGSGDEVLIAGGTSKLVTLLNVTVDPASPDPSPVKPRRNPLEDTVPPQPPQPLKQQQLEQRATAATTTSASTFSPAAGTPSDSGKVSALLKRVAELELDLMQAQAVGSELTRRVLTQSQQPPRDKTSTMSAAVGASASPSPSRRLHRPPPPGVNIGIQVDSRVAPSPSPSHDHDPHHHPSAFADKDEKEKAAFDEVQRQTLAEYALRVEELETDNVALRERLAAAEDAAEVSASLSAAPSMGSVSVSAGGGGLPSPSSVASGARPIDDYELRCMQRLILENERLRGQLGNTRAALNDAQVALTNATQNSASGGANPSGSNLLTVCFLTMRSVIGHQAASDVMLTAMGENDEASPGASPGHAGGGERQKPTEVQTIERMVYELCIRLDPEMKVTSPLEYYSPEKPPS